MPEAQAALGFTRTPSEDDPRRDPELLAALRSERGNVKRASVALGISRSRLYRLMEKHPSLDLEGLRRAED